MAEKKAVSMMRGAANILTNMLQRDEWYGSAKYVYLAGEVLAKVLPEPEPTKLDGLALKTHLDEALALEFEARQLKVCKACIQFFIDKKQIVPNKYLLDLMQKLGMTPDETED